MLLGPDHIQNAINRNIEELYYKLKSKKFQLVEEQAALQEEFIAQLKAEFEKAKDHSIDVSNISLSQSFPDKEANINVDLPHMIAEYKLTSIESLLPSLQRANKFQYTAKRKQPTKVIKELDFIDEDFISSSSFDPFVNAMQSKSPNFNTVMSAITKLSQQPNSDRAPLPPTDYACAQGGGAKGAAYTGTVKAMDETGDLENFKGVAGASAGAINAFMLGLGLNGRQVEEMIRNINFLDLNDYSDKALTKINKALAHSGENFYNWARALIEHVTGDADITFAEYSELCKTNSNLKDIAFKGTNLDKNGTSVTFSASLTPNVRIVDAVRASMSFPGAFEPWKVYEKIKGQLKLYGNFTDGGVLNNFPIDIFNAKQYEDPHYKRVDTEVGSIGMIPRNPCSVGLALCSLAKLNPDITPFTTRLKALQVSKNIKPKTLSLEEELTQDQWDWTYTQLGKALLSNKLGLNPEDPQAKYSAHKDQTVQIYTEEVGTLEFQLSPEKQKLIENSGYNSWMQWHKAKKDPEAFYDQEVDFDIDFIIRNSEGKVIHNPSQKEVCAHFEQLFTEYFTVLLTEAQRRRNQNDSGDILRNQRMKFYSHQIRKGIDIYLGKKLDVSIDDVLHKAFSNAIQTNEAKKKSRVQHEALLDHIVNEDLALEHLIDLLKSPNEKDHLKALGLFKGKLTNIFKYMEKSQGDVLALGIRTGNPIVVKEMIGMLVKTMKMIEQTGRRLPYKITTLLNEASPTSLYSDAMGSQNAKAVLPILLSTEFNPKSTALINPLTLDCNGKNAFHYAIDYDNIEALSILVDWAHLNKINISTLAFGHTKNTLGHYIVTNASSKMLKALMSNPDLLKTVVSNTAVNGFGHTCTEVVANNLYKSESVQDFDKPSELDIFRTICSLGGDLKTDSPATILKHNRLKAMEKKSKLFEIQNKIDIDKAFLINDSSYVNKLTAKECLTILESDEGNGLNFLCKCAKNPELAKVAEALCYKAYKDNSTYADVMKLMSDKYNGKSPLFYAAESNNPEMISLLRSYDMSVNSAGPISCPSALTAAGRAGASLAVLAIINSKSIKSKKKIIRRVTDDQGKTAVHWLAQNAMEPQTVAQALYSVITTGYTGFTDFHVISSSTDVAGNSPFFYLLSNPNAKQILEAMLKLGEPRTRLTSGYKLDTYFDFKTKRANGYTDLEMAYMINPELADFIAMNLIEPAVAQEAKLTVDAQFKTNEELMKSISVIEHEEQVSSMIDEQGLVQQPNRPFLPALSNHVQQQQLSNQQQQQQVAHNETREYLTQTKHGLI